MGTVTTLKFANEGISVSEDATPARAKVDTGRGWYRCMNVEYTERVAQLFAALLRELGGSFTVHEDILARRIASFAVQLETMEGHFIYDGLTPKPKARDLDAAMARLTQAMAELRELRKSRPNPPVTPSNWHRDKKA